MATQWSTVFLVLTTISQAYPKCFLCTKDCINLTTESVNYPNISLNCDSFHPNLTIFFINNNFTKLHRITIKSPELLMLNLTKISTVKHVNFSYNNLTVFNINSIKYVQNLNLSHNRISKYLGNFTQLINLDLEDNEIKNLNISNFNSTKLLTLNLKSNKIENVCNFTIISLVYLDIRNNSITSLCLGYFPNLKILDLSNNLIRTIQTNLSLSIPTLEVLNISSNYLKELNNNFNLQNLLKLDLKDNLIEYVSEKCFFGLNKLQYLDLSMNKISSVFPSTLQYLSGLIQLIISDNENLSSQDFGLLLASRRLKIVNASRTNQIKIPSSLTRSVRYLILSYNSISQIQCGDLDSYSLLNSLDVANNNISSIEDDALGRLELLTVLILNENSLTSVPYTLPNNLKHLHLRKNLINQITSTDFSGLTQLKQLDLSQNNITAISEDSFLQMFGLQKLNLSHNNIHVISNSILNGPQNLQVLDLSYLLNVTKCNQALCFPVPEKNELQELYLEKSPVLVSRLLNDAAALKTFTQLETLNMANSNLTEIRNDLPNYFPRIQNLLLNGNDINCTLIYTIFSWMDISEIDECIFQLKEIPTTTEIIIKDNFTYKDSITNTTNQNTFFNETNFTNEIIQNNIMPEIANLFINYEPLLNDTNVTTTPENNDNNQISNDIWYKDSTLGVVDAIAADTQPSSHPGLFILLLLPIALVSTCFVINYSRLKRRLQHERRCEMDIEISNISSELW